MLEIIIWALSMLLAGERALNLSNRINFAQVDRLTISERNAKSLSRTFRSEAIGYFLAIPIIAALIYDNTIIKEWWVLEVFIFWNLRSAWLYHKGFQCLSY